MLEDTDRDIENWGGVIATALVVAEAHRK